MKRSALVFSLLLSLVIPSVAMAGGYDTPILYSARHMGMGGAAIGYVSDATALYHNPAGLGQIQFLNVTGDFSPLLGKIVSSPASNGQNAESDLTFAPFFLVGAGVRVMDWLTVGVGVYPVASAGASYTYKNVAGKDILDKTKLVFIEVAPGFAVDLPLNLRLGATYRATIISFQRQQGPAEGGLGNYDMDLSGTNFGGFKVGLQWNPIPMLQAGVVYRHKTVTDVSADSSKLFLQEWGKTTMDITLPSKLGFGVRGDLGPVGAALDLEYGFNSQNEKSSIKATSLKEGSPDFELLSLYHWSDSMTLRAGLEWSLLILKLRGGYIYDAKVSNEMYPSAFGTPPDATQTITAGVGVSIGLAEVNLAYAYRFGTATVTEDDLSSTVHPEKEICLPCSKAGDYELTMHGLYLDASISF